MLAVASPTPLDFETVYMEHFDFVWRSLRRMGVLETALEDLCQEVFVVVHRRLGEFEQRSTIRTWLFGIVMFVAQGHRRTRRRRRDQQADTEPPVDPDTLADAGGNPAERAMLAESVREVSALLDTLDDSRRAILVLAELEEMPVPEIAEALGMNLNTVYARLRSARADFARAAGRRRARDTWRLG